MVCDSYNIAGNRKLCELIGRFSRKKLLQIGHLCHQKMLHPQNFHNIMKVFFLKSFLLYGICFDTQSVDSVVVNQGKGGNRVKEEREEEEKGLERGWLV